MKEQSIILDLEFIRVYRSNWEKYCIRWLLKHLTHNKLQDYTFCGGTILAENKILSAAHCFFNTIYNCQNFFLGETRALSLDNTYAVAASLRNIARGGYKYEQWRTLENLTYPPTYNFPDADIAILFVKKPFLYNDYVKPIEYSKHY
ncbi:hypothetical protein K1T71_001180 [Dendrolimus kikuchii]|uniref:Uncharacterized protein n=1 Tax=Dendrolimus kikuchii TaxID=765133 RepID=A0ACC1DHH4_9NEOP|nr:hypothetical protein K1T71_001180 [Dendrolimus kikuchii]